MENKPDISVVIPVYNSAGMLEELYRELIEALEAQNLRYEVLMVDDDSTDDSWNVLKNLKQKNADHLSIVRLARNYGQHNATLCGLRLSVGEVILTMDDDLQHDPSFIRSMRELMENGQAEVVYGVGNGGRSRARQATSKLWKAGARAADEGIGVGSSFRLIRRRVVDKVCSHQQNVVFIDELLQWYTLRIESVPVVFRSRAEGKSGYTPRRLWHFMFDNSLSYSAFPLKLMTWGGMFLAAVSGLVGVYFVIRKLFGNVEQGFTALIVAILFSTSILLFCLGIIGQYLARIFNTLNRKPTYSISEQEL